MLECVLQSHHLPLQMSELTANLHIAKKHNFFGKGILEQNSIGYKENATLQQKHSVTYLLHKPETLEVLFGKVFLIQIMLLRHLQFAYV